MDKFNKYPTGSKKEVIPEMDLEALDKFKNETSAKIIDTLVDDNEEDDFDESFYDDEEVPIMKQAKKAIETFQEEIRHGYVSFEDCISPLKEIMSDDSLSANEKKEFTEKFKNTVDYLVSLNVDQAKDAYEAILGQPYPEEKVNYAQLQKDFDQHQRDEYEDYLSRQ